MNRISTPSYIWHNMRTVQDAENINGGVLGQTAATICAAGGLVLTFRYLLKIPALPYRGLYFANFIQLA